MKIVKKNLLNPLILMKILVKVLIVSAGMLLKIILIHLQIKQL